MNTKPILLSTALAAAIVTIVALAPAEEPAKEAKSPANQGMMLANALKKSDGCLGIEMAMTMSGKNVIFAWFKDKDAVLEWYYSDVHQQVMKDAFPNYEFGEPLQGVPDGTGPIMAIASITPAKKSAFKETEAPISQISIELYQPVTGGLYLGGRFAPEGVKVKDLKNYTPEEPVKKELQPVGK